MQFWKALRKEQIRPDFSKKADTHFSMHQFRNLFNTVRIPKVLTIYSYIVIPFSPEHKQSVGGHPNSFPPGVCGPARVVRGRLFAISLSPSFPSSDITTFQRKKDGTATESTL